MRGPPDGHADVISELRIRGLGVIGEAEVSFGPGLTVVTGETGAGKTMVLTGLGLIMGEKADAGVVRTGAPSAEVDGEWLLGRERVPDVLRQLDEAGAHVEDQAGMAVVLLGRTVAPEGRSKAFAGGRSVPAGTLALITDGLIAVHGQADQALLREARQQRELLDRFGGSPLAECRASYAGSWTRWRALDADLRSLVERRQDIEREAALLRHGIAEIAAVAPEPGEDDGLKSRATVLAHATDLLAEIGTARALLAGDDDASGTSAADAIGQARRAIDRAAGLDPALAELRDRLDVAAAALGEVSSDLGGYAAGIDADPAQLAGVEDRRQLIAGLKRRYGPGLDDVLAWWQSAQRTVEDADGADARIDELTAQEASARADALAKAATLTAARAEAGQRFAVAVTAELRALAMADAEVQVDVRTQEDPRAFTSDGADAVALLLRPHAGSEPRPLAKGASGGELSRIMLAIEVVLAGVHSVPTFVFDEVDAGIGGKVAVEVGRRLSRLARTAQVIVVTHLPQVAAFGDRHLVVAKDSDGVVTRASVTEVRGDARVRELVRMLSGLEDSEAGARHAEELLALAAGERG